MRRRHYTTPVTVRGVSYPSMNTAAAAHGVTPQTICHHLAVHGHCDRLGIGQGRGKKRGGNNHRARPGVIAGMAFASRRELAEFIGLTMNGLRLVERRGGPAAVAERVIARRMADDRRAA